MPSEWTAWRLCVSLLGDVMGPRGPVTSLPTLSRAREGLKRQGLRRVVTDTVTTLAGDADVRGVVRRAVSSAGSRAHHTSRAIAQRFTQGDDDRCGARWPLPVVSPGCRSSRHPVAPWELAWRPIYARSGSSKDVRSPMTGRASSSDDAARTRGATSRRSGSCRGVHSNARIGRRAWVSQPRDPQRASHGKPQAGVNPVHSKDL